LQRFTKRGEALKRLEEAQKALFDALILLMEVEETNG
jgi:hypothetical protein